MLYEINETTELVVYPAIMNAESTEITGVVKQGLLFEPTMSCTTTQRNGM